MVILVKLRLPEFDCWLIAHFRLGEKHKFSNLSKLGYFHITEIM